MSYVELHCHSAFSFLDGASSPGELAAAAAELGHEALALTDHDGLCGSMEMAHAATALGLRPITGAELTLEGGAHLTLLCEDRTGYRNLCRLITASQFRSRRTRRRSGEPTGTGLLHLGAIDLSPETSLAKSSASRPVPPGPDTMDRREAPGVTLDELERHAEGLVCLSGCAREGALGGRISNDPGGARALGERLARAFGRDRFRVELQRPLWRRDRQRNRLLADLAADLGVACVATGNVHCHHRLRAPLQDAFVAVRLRLTLDESEPLRRGNGAHALASPEEVARRFADHPEAVAESGRIAERLRFDLTRDLGYRYPGSDDPDADRRLAELCQARLDDRYGDGPDLAEATARLDEELRIIRGLGLSGFFELHHDLLELAREVALEVRGAESARSLLPPGRGRGSSVSSIVCHLTGLSHIDPIRNRLFLGRFLSEEMTSLPDIDLDFPRDVREALLPRIHQRYGHEHSALVGAFATYRWRGAVRDLGKALGLPPAEVERAAKAIESHGTPEAFDAVLSDALGRRTRSERWRWLIRLARDAYGLPRHISQHSGGMVLSTDPIVDLCPVQPAAMEGRQILQWDKDSCADAGFLKIDLLGLGMLSAVERCVETIASARGERIDLSRIPYDDPEVYRTIQAAETTGVFQIESRAQMQMLPRTMPANLDDLTVQVALVRPGPIQGGAVHPYIERRKRLREDPKYRVPYEHPDLEPILRDTLGAIVFQDQVLEVAMALAGFGPGEAEGLRRAMSRKRSEEALRVYHRRFIKGAMSRGVPRATADRVFDQIVGFAGFGFPKAHGAAFGLLAYQSTWLRVHHGPEFLCSLLNEQPMGFYPPDALVHDAQRRGIEVLPPDINHSDVECDVESHPHLSVRIGLGYVSGVIESEVRGLVAERLRGGDYASISDLASRSGAGAETLERLAWAGATDALAVDRRRALWEIGTAAGGIRVKGGEQLALPLDVPAAPELPGLDRWERLVASYESIGVALEDHPIAAMRDQLEEGVSTSADLALLPDGSPVEVAGMVVARQRPATAKGVTFMLLEDERGMINLVVRTRVYDRHRLAVRAEPLVRAEGRLQRREGTTSVIVERIFPLEKPGQSSGDVHALEPRADPETDRTARAAALRAAAPEPHSFGRRAG